MQFSGITGVNLGPCRRLGEGGKAGCMDGQLAVWMASWIYGECIGAAARNSTTSSKNNTELKMDVVDGFGYVTTV